jgi:hypothetical protein
MLTQELVRELFDYKDGILYWKKSNQNGYVKTEKAAGFKWFDKKTGYTRYRVGIHNREYYVHRIVFLLHHGYLPKGIDHINGDATDNRIENLRPANQSQNMSNAKLYKTNTSGVKGVFWAKDIKRWRACIILNYKKIYLGCYKTIEEATEAVKQKRIELHKEFARNE